MINGGRGVNRTFTKRKDIQNHQKTLGYEITILTDIITKPQPLNKHLAQKKTEMRVAVGRQSAAETRC